MIWRGVLFASWLFLIVVHPGEPVEKIEAYDIGTYRQIVSRSPDIAPGINLIRTVNGEMHHHNDSDNSFDENTTH